VYLAFFSLADDRVHQRVIPHCYTPFTQFTLTCIVPFLFSQ